MNIKMMMPQNSDCFHNALSCLGHLLLDREMTQKHDVEELGCLLLILADYARLMEYSLDN